MDKNTKLVSYRFVFSWIQINKKYKHYFYKDFFLVDTISPLNIQKNTKCILNHATFNAVLKQ